MKKPVLFIVSSIALLVSLPFMVTGCREVSKTGVIGISKIVAHPALDAVEQGIQDELADLGYEFQYDLQNANGDANAAKTIATKFMANRVRVAVGIATPTAQALVGTISDIPVVFSAVTDPVDAGLVESLDKGSGNVTGISDLTPVKAQIEFLKKLTDIKTLGHIYTSSEQNAQVLAQMAEEACGELDIEFIATTVTKSAEVKQAAQLMAPKVDAFYVSTDNTVVSALAALVEVATDNNIPIMSADPSSAETNGVLAAWGFDYYKMGRATGKLIDEILKGKNPDSIPTRFMTDPADTDLLINLDVAKKLGITIPESVVKTASKVIENGSPATK
ncbi:MAG: ABC transporter substrate-binding protein [Spirochaetales bacterium]|nr:ABC transporter substrate-binding protein [Spirochaetales bacterium]